MSRRRNRWVSPPSLSHPPPPPCLPTPPPHPRPRALTTAPANGQWLEFQPCNRRAPGQKWYLTDDGRFALQDQGFCIDLPAGSGENLDGVQLWQCGDGNINQEWIVHGEPYAATSA